MYIYIFRSSGPFLGGLSLSLLLETSTVSRSSSSAKVVGLTVLEYHVFCANLMNRPVQSLPRINREEISDDTRVDSFDCMFGVFSYQFYHFDCHGVLFQVRTNVLIFFMGRWLLYF